MRLRVPDNLLFEKSQTALTKTRNNMVDDQEKAISGRRVNKPSDDPTATMRAMSLKSKMRQEETLSTNLDVATSFLNLTDSALGELTDVLQRAKELAIQMSSTSNFSDDSRKAVAQEVEQLFMQAVQISNTRLGDRYVFAGFQTDRAPFDSEGNYFGDSGKMELEMGGGQRVSVNMPGLIPFFGIDEMPRDAERTRMMPTLDKVPTLEGGLRNPASVIAENQGMSTSPTNDEYQALERKHGVNLFAALKGFRTGLELGEKGLVNDSLDSLDRAFQQVLTARSVVGARQNVVSATLNSMEASKANDQGLLSATQDADVLEVYSDLNKNQTVLQASLEMNKRILTPSLLDFLK